MDRQQKSLRLGAAVILCAVVLRLAAGGFFQPVADFLTQPNVLSLLLFLETGRIVRFPQSSGETPVFALESPKPDFSAAISPEKPVFSAGDAENVTLKTTTGLQPDLAALLTRPLDWELTGDAPTVLILHTHATESYTRVSGEDYRESAAFRTLDERYNMVSVGDRLQTLLEAGGIPVLHDRTLHDYPSYNGSYSHARKSMEEYLAQYPSIRLVLDIHRDASGDNQNQLRTSATVNGVPAAQIMLVVGSSASGLTHPDWEENLALALKLHVELERTAPGICRYVNLRAQRFNQDESPGALLVEVGAAGNTHAEAITAVEVLAQSILSLAHGAEIE